MTTFGATPLPELRKKLDEAKARYEVAALAIAPIQNEISALRDAISDALMHDAANLFQASGKQSGDLTMTVDGAGKFKASISKTVKWDSSKLQMVAAKLPWEKTVAIFKIDFSVPEAKFAALKDVDPELADILTDARTVKYGDLRISIIE